MIAWIKRKARIFFLVMTVSPFLVGGFFLYGNYYIYPKSKETFDSGVETLANVEGGTRMKRRRSGSSTISLDLSWQDQSGRTRTEKVWISSSLADKIIRNDALTVETLSIKYLDSDPTARPLILADLPPTGPPPPVGLELAYSLWPLFLIGVGGLYFLRHRE
jgi:hypothetical protein